MKLVAIAICACLAGCAPGAGSTMHLSPAASPQAVETSVAPLPPNSSLPDVRQPRPAESAAASATSDQTRTSSAPVAPTGKWGFNAERVAKTAHCADEPAARLTGSGPTFENYSVMCRDGSAMTIRCDDGRCTAS